MARLERFGNQIFQSHCQDWKIWGSFFNEIMGDSLTVEQRTLTPLVEVRILSPRTLTPLVEVRILVPQPMISYI